MWMVSRDPGLMGDQCTDIYEDGERQHLPAVYAKLLSISLFLHGFCCAYSSKHGHRLLEKKILDEYGGMDGNGGCGSDSHQGEIMIIKTAVLSQSQSSAAFRWRWRRSGRTTFTGTQFISCPKEPFGWDNDDAWYTHGGIKYVVEKSQLTIFSNDNGWTMSSRLQVYHNSRVLLREFN